MRPRSFMLIAGETSGDLLAAELVRAMQQQFAEAPPPLSDDSQPLRASLEPRFFGAGGPHMAAAGVDLHLDLAQHSVIGLSDVLKNLPRFRRIFHELFDLAIQRAPDAIIMVDFSGFNRRFAHAMRKRLRKTQSPFTNWRPKLIQYVSPQVWASRPDRAFQLQEDLDLLLCTFPFEPDWYASFAPKLRVEFVGNPIVDRHARLKRSDLNVVGYSDSQTTQSARTPLVVLLPGSRAGEIKRHVPVLVDAARQIAATTPARFRLIAPNQRLADQARTLGTAQIPNLELVIGGLEEALAQADIAIASTGTVTLECAYFGVPTVALYKTSWLTYVIAKQLVTVKYLSMPNLLADKEVFPEFVQGAAASANIASAAIELMNNPERRRVVKAELARIVERLGEPGSAQRAARLVWREVGF